MDQALKFEDVRLENIMVRLTIRKSNIVSNRSCVYLQPLLDIWHCEAWDLVLFFATVVATY